MGSVLSSEPQAPEERSALQKEINKVMLGLRLGLGLLTICATLYPNQVIAENPVVIVPQAEGGRRSGCTRGGRKVPCRTRRLGR